MHPARVQTKFRQLIAGGAPVRLAARQVGVPVSTAYRWAASSAEPASPRGPVCWVCEGEEPPEQKATPYAYLLGQYLGDGHLVTSARVPVLRIYASADYPRIRTEVLDAIRCVRERTAAVLALPHTVAAVNVQSYWMHWPCLFPQHGPGRKHKRPIVLEPWQQQLVDAHPWSLIRGLIHSDGCRSLNRVVVHGRRYEYPRYFFANESRDILAITGRALDRVGVAWRFNRPNSISIARRDSVARLEANVGPKR